MRELSTCARHARLFFGSTDQEFDAAGPSTFLQSSKTLFVGNPSRNEARYSCVADRMKCTDNILQKINFNELY